MFARRIFATAPRACNARMYSSSSGPASRGGGVTVQSSSPAKKRTGLSSEVDGESWGNGGTGGKLPAVPNTEHLHPSEVAASSFFALHRPLSIKHAIPQVHSTTAFNSIFDPISLTQDANASSTLLPLSTNPTTITSSPGSPSPSTFTTHHPPQRPSKIIERTMMGDLESLVSSIRDNWATGSFKQSSLATSINRANSAARAREGSVFSPEGDFSARLFPTTINAHLPFHPPPNPVPRTAESSIENIRPQRQLITIHQTIYPNGVMMFTARSKVIGPMTSPYMQRVRERQRENMEQWQERVMEERDGAAGGQVSEMEERDRDMMAISVKRRRGLKMKKHKYKKLRVKTRNLRRRLEKQ
ncbi:hypothetical protein EV426DRAFT_300237 [Tirmania nivea]|nr:hypothetical protein EV426DRAFT_300237 [Tirmania nivea]